jgi:hypothetical protein
MDPKKAVFEVNATLPKSDMRKDSLPVLQIFSVKPNFATFCSTKKRCKTAARHIMVFDYPWRVFFTW